MQSMDPPGPNVESRGRASDACHEAPAGIATVFAPRDADFEKQGRRLAYLCQGDGVM